MHEGKKEDFFDPVENENAVTPFREPRTKNDDRVMQRSYCGT